MQIDFIEIYGIVFQSGFYVNRYRQMEIDSDRKIKKSKETRNLIEYTTYMKMVWMFLHDISEKMEDFLAFIGSYESLLKNFEYSKNCYFRLKKSEEYVQMFFMQIQIPFNFFCYFWLDICLFSLILLYCFLCLKLHN